MLWDTCIIDSSAANACVKLSLVKNGSEDDESYANAKRGIASYIHCMCAKFTKQESENLGFALKMQYLLWTAIHFLILLVLVSVSQNHIAMRVVNSTLGLIIINGMAFTGIAVLAATKHLKVLRYICEWYVFCSQILFAYSSETSPGITSGAKCAAQLALLSLSLLCISMIPRVKTAGIFTGLSAVFASVTFVFILHAISPYESVLRLYVAIMYSLGWCMYMIHESFQWVLVRSI
ncbi:hypothetical protein GGH92_001128 [Coemansia sp. RSA 2673]|nr:hypothetical protein GGH92_001128 [Coemansia sp. RSA 2673]